MPGAFKLDHLQPVKLIFISSSPSYWESNYLLPERERKAEYEKTDSLKSEWDTGVSVPVAFKLDHLQPVKLNLSKNISNFLIFILGLPFPITPESNFQRGGNEKKGITQEWGRHRVLCTWGIQTLPFAACWADFIPKNFHLYPQPPIISNLLLLQREKGRNSGWKMENGCQQIEDIQRCTYKSSRSNLY